MTQDHHQRTLQAAQAKGQGGTIPAGQVQTPKAAALPATRSPSPVAPRLTAKPPQPRAGEAADFQQQLQAIVDDGDVMKLTADVILDTPVVITITKSNRGWFGLDGCFHKIHSTVAGQPALTFVMPQDIHGVCARGFFLGNLTMLGNQTEEGALKIDAAAGDSWLVNAHLENLWVENFGGKAALACRGNVFESSWYDVSTMDNAGAGIHFVNAGAGAIVSAMHLFGGTQRQNGGAGILVDQYDGPGDISVYGMYFCENKGGGYHSWAGVELLSKCGFENNVDFGINVQNYAHLHRCTGSTHGTQPQLIIGYLANPWVIDDCSMVGYGGADPHFGSFTGNGQPLTLRGRYDPAKLTIGQGVDPVFVP
jgi:hypothetical protein